MSWSPPGTASFSCRSPRIFPLTTRPPETHLQAPGWADGPGGLGWAGWSRLPHLTFQQQKTGSATQHGVVRSSGRSGLPRSTPRALLRHWWTTERGDWARTEPVERRGPTQSVQEEGSKSTSSRVLQDERSAHLLPRNRGSGRMPTGDRRPPNSGPKS